MSWCASDPSFDIRTYFDYCSATKPPYSCPYAGCNGKVYRTFAGIQTHIEKTHAQETKPNNSSNSDHELEGRYICDTLKWVKKCSVENPQSQTVSEIG